MSPKVQTFVISALPDRYVETRRHKIPVKMRVTNFGKKIKYSVESESDQKEKNEEGKNWK